MTDPQKLIDSLNRDQTLRHIEWLEGLALRLERAEPFDITDINGLRSLAQSFKRGLE